MGESPSPKPVTSFSYPRIAGTAVNEKGIAIKSINRSVMWTVPIDHARWHLYP
jgi:hypothetical protein